MSLSQRTVAERISISGVGLHSGQPVTLTLVPAPANSGVVFVRTDLPGRPEVPARPEFVVDTALATSLGRGAARVGTVEHLLAALVGMGIDNVRAELDGPEVPIMDGSSAPFCFLIRSVGTVSQSRPKNFLVIKRPVEVREGDKFARLVPAARFSVSCTIDFRHPLITDQTFRMDFSDRTFDREIAKARTFGFLRDVEKLKSIGLARGGSLDNAIVVDDFNILNPDGLRFPDEFVRHKILDAVGDLSLLGMPVVGHLEAYKSGHALNQKLVGAILADAEAYAVVAAGRELERWRLQVPAFGVAAEVA
jgi:UDP-3-O-[3-hydroxymyristoyl] N-acetylglucosamine deacetylase